MQKQYIINDLNKKMVFVVGPRQVGKTWLAQTIGQSFSETVYLNYDHAEDREIISNESWLPSTELLILDELHKMPDWKNYLKGVYDTKIAKLKILVTGSARLDIFNQVGDSLAGRYFMHRLMPLSPSELSQVGTDVNLDLLITRGGFPEPYAAATDIEADRWRLQYVDSLMRADVLEFDNIQNIRAIQMVFELLRRRVGSPISFTSIAEDVAISPNTVKRYISILEALYIVFRVTPYSKNIARSLLKEPKIYFYDTGLVIGDNGVKTENLVGLCLLKHVFAKNDYQGQPYKLCYLRTKEKQEVDFALVCADEIVEIIEVKHSNASLSKNLLYFQQKYQLQATQLVKSLKREKLVSDIPIRDLQRYLLQLDL